MMNDFYDTVTNFHKQFLEIPAITTVQNDMTARIRFTYTQLPIICDII